MLPKNRQIKKLGEVSSVVRGLTYKPDQVRDQSKGIACFRTKNVQTTLDESDIIYIDPVLVKSEEKLLKTGDILVSSANSVELLGKCCLIENLSYKATLGGFICALRYQENIIDYMFLYYHFNSENTQKKLRSFANKTTGIANLPIPKMMDEIQIPLPPLNTQQAIVAKLDQIHAEISSNQQAIHQQLSQLDELWQSSLDQIFSNEEWEKVKLGDVLDVRDGTHDSPKFHKNGYPLITSKNLSSDGLDLNNVKYISEEDYIAINQRSKVDKGDMLFAMIGTIGNPTIVDHDPVFAIKNVALFKAKDQDVLMQYLRYYLLLSQTINKMLNESKGATQKFVGLGYLRSFNIPLPDLATQKAAVAKLDQIHEYITQLKNEYNKQLTQYEELRASVLDQAFKGQLVE